ncbi:MAG: bile acid:sodium symporter [Gaiellaceae bacterium]
MRRRPAALLEPLPLVLVAAGAGLALPSEQLASHADLVLAALVLAVPLTIAPERLRAATSAWPRIGVAVLLPLATLLALAIGLSLLFDGPAREGLLALGLAPSEVALVALVALAGGDAAVALTAVTLSLVVSALAAPLIAPLLVDTELEPSQLLVRFSLVVLVPLAPGLALRTGGRLARVEPAAERAATLLLALLVYAALGDLDDLSALGPASLAAALFLAASLVPAWLLLPLLADLRTGAFAFALRDFAVAATLSCTRPAPERPPPATACSCSSRPRWPPRSCGGGPRCLRSAVHGWSLYGAQRGQP